MNNDTILTITQASQLYYITRQALAIAIKSKRLKAEKVKNHWCFTVKEYQNYEKSRYDRKYSVRNGKHIYDEENGMLSPCMIAKEFKIKTQQVYYLLRLDVVPFYRVGHAYVIKRKDFIENASMYFNKKKKNDGIRANDANSNDRNKKTKTLSKKSKKNNKRRLR